jgi:hypothetical protein
MMIAVNPAYSVHHSEVVNEVISHTTTTPLAVDRMIQPRKPRVFPQPWTLVVALLMMFLPLQQPVDARICVSVPTNGDEYYHHNHQCTDDPLVLTNAVDPTTGVSSNRYNLGLDQRIDGTESEKQAIRDVLVRMDEYYIHEVLAHPEYASVRNRWYVSKRAHFPSFAQVFILWTVALTTQLGHFRFIFMIVRI